MVPEGAGAGRKCCGLVRRFFSPSSEGGAVLENPLILEHIQAQSVPTWPESRGLDDCLGIHQGSAGLYSSITTPGWQSGSVSRLMRWRVEGVRGTWRSQNMGALQKLLERDVTEIQQLPYKTALLVRVVSQDFHARTPLAMSNHMQAHPAGADHAQSLAPRRSKPRICSGEAGAANRFMGRGAAGGRAPA